MEDDIAEIKTRLESLEKRRSWAIATLSAFFAAVASITSAYMSYGSSVRTELIRAGQNAEFARIDEGLNRRRLALHAYTVAVEAYRQFGDHIIEGDPEKRCRALVVLSALGSTELNSAHELLASKLDCEKDAEAIRDIAQSRTELRARRLTEHQGKSCVAARATFTTLRLLKSTSLQARAHSICHQVKRIPKDYRWFSDDQSVSFETDEYLEGNLVWCNCHPT